jgi:hypothetical protein
MGRLEYWIFVRRIGYVLYKDNLKYTGVGGALDCE